MRCVPFFCQPCVKRPSASTNQQQKDETEQHAHIRAGFMQRSPKPVFRKRDDFGRIKGNRDFCREKILRKAAWINKKDTLSGPVSA
jgi:hypothetical protein